MESTRRPEWLNYHHLQYFWMVAREGSVRGAARRLGVSQPTISAQLKALEGWLGVPLLRRSGGALVLTEQGRLVLAHADEIFAAGRALVDAVRGRAAARPVELAVGVADVLPKALAVRLLSPTLHLTGAGRLVCVQDRTERLIADLAVHGLDLVLTDAPIGAAVPVRAYNHLLGQCAVTVMGTPALAARYGRRFPASLDGAPFLLPTQGAAVRPALDRWFEAQGLRPQVAAECQDGGLLKAFAEAGAGLVVVPAVVAGDVRERYGLRRLGEIPDVQERFYAVSLERRIRQPAVALVTEAARVALFQTPSSAAETK